MSDERIELLINTDMVPRTWKPYDSESRYAAACHPFLEIGSLPCAEYAELERNSVKEEDGWMVERW